MTLTTTLTLNLTANQIRANQIAREGTASHEVGVAAYKSCLDATGDVDKSDQAYDAAYNEHRIASIRADALATAATCTAAYEARIAAAEAFYAARNAESFAVELHRIALAKQMDAEAAIGSCRNESR